MRHATNNLQSTKRPATGVEPRLLHEFFENQVESRPQSVAVECGGEILTYRQLDDVSNQIAAILHSNGVRPGCLVALYLEKSPRLYAAMLGILKAGAGYVPIDPRFPVGRIQSILEDAKIATVISEGKLGCELAPHVGAQFVSLDIELARRLSGARSSSPPIAPVAVAPNDVCYVIYTSGSTGRPKGVVIEHRNAVNFVRSLRTVYQLGAGDRVYQGFSVAFDASVEEVWGAFSVGGTLVVPGEELARSTFDVPEFINSRRVTFFSTVPSFLAMIKVDLPSVKLLVVGGEACPPELVNRWAQPGRRVLNTYGPTEATVVATLAECIPGGALTIGTPLPGYVAWVLDEDMRPVQPGEAGELYLGGESLARGYLNQPKLTADSFVEFAAGVPDSPSGRLYRTRDLVRLTDSGDLQFVGRTDTQIKIRGFRIELSEIEAVLMDHPSIQAAAVKVVEFGKLHELAAYVVVEGGVGELERDSVAALLRRRVPDYMVPRYLDIVDRLPAMNSGKVDRKLLPPPHALLVGSKRRVVAPATELERAIAEIWEKIFQVSPISVEDDFFLDLRGHSLTAAQVVSEMRAVLGTVQVSVRDLYSYRTVRALATHLKDVAIPCSPRSEAALIEFSPTDDAKIALPWFRWPCAVLQLFGVLLLYASVSAPAVFAVVMVLKVLNGDIDFTRAAEIATFAGFLVWPTWLFLSIALKWIVIGRYKVGRHPVWGFYYFRWWLVNRFQGIAWPEMFEGTPLMSLYYRAMGAKVGKNCTIGTHHCTAFDLVAIGNDTSIGSDTQLLGYRVENGWLIFDKVTIGNECFVGTHCCLGLNSVMQDGARLGDMSLLTDNAVIESLQDMCGSPAAAAELDLPDMPKQRKSFGASFLFGLIHLGLFYAMSYVLIASALPALALVGYALYMGGPWWGVAAAFASVPLSLVWYLALVVAIKRMAIGRILPGIYSLYSVTYLRYWFLNFLLNNTRHIILPFYATLFLPQFLRWLGAKIGPNVEISTVLHVMPDLLQIGGGSFLADACIVGAHHIHRGYIDICASKVGERSFIGNSALVPAGVEIGDDSLVGVMSVPPSGVARTPNGVRWLGSPSFELPLTQQVSGFGDQETFSPSRKLVRQRMCVETLRVLLPGFLVMASLVLFCSAIAIAYGSLPLWQVGLLAPVCAFALSLMSVAAVAAFKKLFMGTFTPTMKPLWSTYVWFNEVVNGLYESVAALALAPLMGTPFIAPCLRMMGCKIGRWVFLETTLFSEFDLVDIGDYAALNLGSTIQTHLFEDRVMKADYLKIGNGCTVGNMTVVLYGSAMQGRSALAPLSVLMKGEVLPAFSRWSGIPTKPVDTMPLPEVVAQSLVPSDDAGRSTGEDVRPRAVLRQGADGA